MNQIKITGYWDGQPIWREKTVGEILAEYIDEDLAHKKNMTKEQLEKYEKEIEKIYPDSFISEEEQNIIDPNYN